MLNQKYDKREISTIIRNERLKKGITIEELGDMAGIGSSTVARAMNPEKALNVSYESLYKMYEALDIPVPDSIQSHKYEALNSKYIYCDEEELKEFPILTVLHFLIYFPLLLDNCYELFDALHRIEGRFSGRNSVYEFDQLKRLFNAIDDGPLKEYADYLVARTTNGFSEDAAEMINNYDSEGATLYLERLDWLSLKSSEIQSRFDELMERKSR